MNPSINPQRLYRALAITDDPELTVAYSSVEIDDALEALVDLAIFGASQVLSRSPVRVPLPPASAQGLPMQLNEQGTSDPAFNAHDEGSMRNLMRALVIDGAFNPQVGIRPGQLVDPHSIPMGDQLRTSPVVEGDPDAIGFRRPEQFELPPIVADLLPPNVKMWAAVTLWAANNIGKLIKNRRANRQ